MSHPEMDILRAELLYISRKLHTVAIAHAIFHKDYPYIGVPQTLQVAFDALHETVRVCEEWSKDFTIGEEANEELQKNDSALPKCRIR